MAGAGEPADASASQAPAWQPRDRGAQSPGSEGGTLTLSTSVSHPLASSGAPQTLDSSTSDTQPAQSPGSSGPSDPLSSSAPSDPLSSSLNSSGPSDPLNSKALGPLDPLSAPNPSSKRPNSSSTVGSSAKELSVDEEEQEDFRSFVPWSTRKTQIVQSFTTTGTIQMPQFVSVEVAKAGRGSNSLKARLDSIDEGDDDVSMVRLNAREYVLNMSDMNQELVRAWDSEERVKALKMAIQCAKLLSDSSTPQFYPSLFVLVTEILDTFGKLVFDRIKQKGLTVQGLKKTRLEDFGPNDVTEEARETCKNWFFKIASIRELIPRVYMEMAIIRAYQFLYGYRHFEQALSRLSRLLRGIGDPLASVYARAYLVRKSRDINKSLIGPLADCFSDSILTIRQLKDPHWNQHIVTLHKLDIKTYVELFGPALDWILHCLGQIATREKTLSVLRESSTLLDSQTQEETDASKTIDGTAYVLQHVLENFDPKYISGVAVDITKLINDEVGKSGIDATVQLYGSLGKCLVHEPPPESQRLPLLNEIWKHVTKTTDIQKYVKVSVTFVEYVIKFFGKKELNLLLTDLLRHLGKGRAQANLIDDLKIIALKTIQQENSFQKLISLDAFMPFVDVFQGTAQVEVNKALLKLFNEEATEEKVSRDPVVVHTAFAMAKGLHDSIDSMAVDDERRQVSELISVYLQKVQFGEELEQHLNFLVDSRRFLVHLDLVTKTLTMSVLGLVAKANRRMKGQHNRRTMAFVKACLAFAHVTIPSVEDRVWQLKSMELAGQMSLNLGLLSQADTFFKAAITIIPDLPNSNPSDEVVIGLISSYSATLVAVPGHPEHGPFYLVKGLLNAVKEYPFQGGDIVRVQAYGPIINLLCCLAQQKTLFRIGSVEANDILFGRDSEYVVELQAMLDMLVKEALNTTTTARNPHLALSLLNRFFASAQLSPSSVTVVWDLFCLSRTGMREEERVCLTNITKYCLRLSESSDIKKARLYEELGRRMLAKV